MSDGKGSKKAAAPPEIKTDSNYEVPKSLWLRVGVTALLRRKQKQYGILLHEYKRYSAYCARRAARLREILRGRPASTGMKGPIISYNPKFNQSTELLELLCYKADGAWASFRQIKALGRGSDARSHAKLRLQKSLQFWNRAVEAAKIFGDDLTCREVEAWRDMLLAVIALEKKDWQGALASYTHVRDVFLGFSQQEGDADLAAAAGDLVEDISPIIDLCNFNLGGAGEAGPSTIRDVHRQLVWRDRTFTVTHDVVRKKMAEFDALSPEQIVVEAHAAREIVSRLLAARETDELRALDEYLAWRGFSATLVLSREKYEKKDGVERAVVATQVHARLIHEKQTFGDLPQLLAEERLWYARRLMALSSLCKEEEGISLLGAALDEARVASGLIVPNEEAEAFAKTVQRMRIERICRRGMAKREGVGTKSLTECMDQYVPCIRALVDIPPRPRTVFPKPALFNLAEDYLEYPAAPARKAGWLKFW